MTPGQAKSTAGARFRKLWDAFDGLAEDTLWSALLDMLAVIAALVSFRLFMLALPVASYGSFAALYGLVTTFSAITYSGPGLALKGEALGLAVATELPLVLIDIQRGGPSTGLPTKTEQADLFQAMYGRNGEAPCAVIAAQSARGWRTDCDHVVSDGLAHPRAGRQLHLPRLQGGGVEFGA